MIQFHAQQLYPDAIPEFVIPGGSKTGLVFGWTRSLGKLQLVFSGMPTGRDGEADLVRFFSGELWEIKSDWDCDFCGAVLAQLEATWYIQVYNALPGFRQPPKLTYGRSYIPHPGWFYIGPDPIDDDYSLLATQRLPGAITWRNVPNKKVREYKPTYSDFYVEDENGQPVLKKGKHPPDARLDSDILEWLESCGTTILENLVPGGNTDILPLPGTEMFH